MDISVSIIEPLFKRAEQFGKTNIALIKLQVIDKAADIMSRFISRMLFMIVMLIFTLTLNVGVSLWLGEILGKNYFGFLIVASVYAFIGFILYCMHKSIKLKINNMIIAHLLKSDV